MKIYYRNKTKQHIILTKKEYNELIGREAKEIQEEDSRTIEEIIKRLIETEQDFEIVDENGKLIKEW